MPTDGHLPINCTVTNATTLLHTGITTKPPHGEPIYYPDTDGELWKEIGRIRVHNNHIDIWPFHNVLPSEMDYLHGAAIDTLTDKPTKAGHWTRKRDGKNHYWVTTICVPVDDQDGHANAIRRAQSFSQDQTRMFDALMKIGIDALTPASERRAS